MHRPGCTPCRRQHIERHIGADWNWHHRKVTADGFASPEEAALANWTPAANAQVRSVTVRCLRAEVVVDTDQSNREYLDYVYCVRR